jgi:hypothetical protein
MCADLLVVRNRHWPAAFEAGDNMFPVGADGKVATADIDFVETWKAMEAVHLKGKAKAIGVSNFSQHEINRLLEEGSVVSAVYQMECHPLLAQDQFNPWHEEKGIHVTQYNPFSEHSLSDLGPESILTDTKVTPIAPTHSIHRSESFLKTPSWPRWPAITARAQRRLLWLGDLRIEGMVLEASSFSHEVSFELTFTGALLRNQRLKDAFELVSKRL